MKVKFSPSPDDAFSHKDLTPGNVYRVISLEADHTRIMSDEGLPYCYPSSLFVFIDSEQPDDWIVTFDEAGERYAAPKSLAAPGFFERYFDGDKEAHKLLRKRLQRWRLGYE